MFRMNQSSPGAPSNKLYHAFGMFVQASLDSQHQKVTEMTLQFKKLIISISGFCVHNLNPRTGISTPNLCFTIHCIEWFNQAAQHVKTEGFLRTVAYSVLCHVYKHQLFAVHANNQCILTHCTRFFKSHTIWLRMVV